MLFDVATSFSSPRAPLSGSDAAARLRLSLQAGPLCLIPRTLPDDMAAALDRLAADHLPTVDVSGSLRGVRTAVESAIAPAGPAPVFAWLRDDVLALAALYADTTGASRIRLRLQAVVDDMCRWFHVDEVAFRLLCTYRGPGTEWLPPRALATAPPGAPIDAGLIRQLAPGTVAIMRGARAATPDRPGVLHRSPPLAGTGQARLLLAINEAGT